MTMAMDVLANVYREFQIGNSSGSNGNVLLTARKYVVYSRTFSIVPLMVITTTNSSFVLFLRRFREFETDT